MIHVSDWSYIAFGLVLIGAGILAYLTYVLLELHSIRVEDRRQQRAFSEDMKGRRGGPTDGATYEWDPDSLAYLADRYTGAPTAPFRAAPPTPAAGYQFEYPVPASTVSGPMPVMNPQRPVVTADTASAEAFITDMLARTAHLVPVPASQPVPAAPADDADMFIAWMEARTTHALKQLGVTP